MGRSRETEFLDALKIWKDRTSDKVQSLADSCADILQVAAAYLQARNGYSTSFMQTQESHDKAGIMFLMRGKNWSKLNTRHEHGADKGTNISSKSWELGSALSGHMRRDPLDSDPETNKLTIKCETEIAEVYELNEKDCYGDPQYATFERQTIGWIEARIASGYYKQIGDVVYDGGLEGFVRTIEDGLGRKFRIFYNAEEFRDANFVTGSAGSVLERMGSFYSKRSLDGAMVKETSSVEERTPVLVISSANETETESAIEYKSMIGLDRLVKQHPEKTVRLLCVDPNTDKVLIEPNILCDKEGAPVKGDVDLQMCMLSLGLPVRAYKYIKASTNQDLFDQLFELYRELEAKRRSGAEFGAEITVMLRHVKRAMQFVHKYQGKDQNNSITKQMGVISLAQAAIVLSTQNGVMHGTEAGSPIPPENMQLTHIPVPGNPGKYYIAHGELELLQILHERENIMRGRSMEFNPTHFVTHRWRADQKPEDNILCLADGKHHPYFNKTDEAAIVHLHELLFEKYLLGLRQSLSEEEFNQHVEIISENIEVQISKLKGKHKEEMRSLMFAGIKIMSEVLERVQECEDVGSRMAIIRSEASEIVRVTKSARHHVKAEKSDRSPLSPSKLRKKIKVSTPVAA